ncbi:hypothetical protein [Marilutibacter alkalisoli]|uniref:Uncharacterized protein n=1 Tax=Marilutibacter alkalisoli TaxID=2591633 RepID=A0A514BVU2_9GAMM|nr:hypothetical protein [Lysobacter alkalisoli]QDH71496.1 hypothetical protein FKV23_16400 [Lysobacter alkalisoli]
MTSSSRHFQPIAPTMRTLFRPFAVSSLCSLGLAIALLTAASRPATATPPPGADARAMIEAWGVDPSVLAGNGADLLQRAPDPAVDALFQAVHRSLQDENESRALCGLFEPGGDRSLDGLNRAALSLGDASRQRLANAVLLVLMSSAQGKPQPYDAEAAGQALKAAAVRATFLNDGFTAALNGNDADARCRAVAQLTTALEGQPQAERAAVTRLLLSQGLTMLADMSSL